MAIRVSNFKIRNYLLKHVLPRLIKTEECRLFIIRILVENLYCIGPSENGMAMEKLSQNPLKYYIIIIRKTILVIWIH